ncbi:hypothetical protein VNO77_20081 [Canavalia gladiata]|uniref:Uncharacterized protein n=1 Tax=Canavalia gladiata TaxID=3824 RepID=A0AAN9LPJ0_CANGL
MVGISSWIETVQSEIDTDFSAAPFPLSVCDCCLRDISSSVEIQSLVSTSLSTTKTLSSVRFTLFLFRTRCSFSLSLTSSVIRMIVSLNANVPYFSSVSHFLRSGDLENGSGAGSSNTSPNT